MVNFAWIYGLKSADQTINSDDTLTDDADMIIALAANTIYEFELFAVWTGDATADFKYAVTVPSGFVETGDAGYYESDNDDVRTGWGDTAGVTAVATNNHAAWMRGVIETTTSGNVTFQWAQNVSNAGGTNLLKNSYIKVRRLS